MLKEIKLEEINNYKDSISLFKSHGIALATSNEGKTNGLTIGWGGLGVLWRKPCATIYIHKTRFSKGIFDNSEYFSINFFEGHEEQLDYFGKVSGRDEDKIANSKLEVEVDNAPYFKDAKLVIICKKMGQTDFDLDRVYEDNIISWYNESGVHTIYLGEIVKVLENK